MSVSIKGIASWAGWIYIELIACHIVSPIEGNVAKLSELSDAHTTDIIVQDERANLEEGRAEDPIIDDFRANNGECALVTVICLLHGRRREDQLLSKDFEFHSRRVLAVVDAVVGTIIMLLNFNTVQLLQKFPDFLVRTRDNGRAGVENSVLNGVPIEFDVGPPEGAVRIFVRPVNKTVQLRKVDIADVETGLAVGTKRKLIRAGLNEVLLLCGPNERVLFHVKEASVGSTKGQAKDSTGYVLSVVLFTTSNSHIPSFDTTDGDPVRVEVAFDMMVVIVKVKGLMQILGRKGLLWVVVGFVKHQVCRARVEHSCGLLGRKANFHVAGPSLRYAEMSLSMGTLLLIEKVHVQNVQVLASPVMMNL